MHNVARLTGGAQEQSAFRSAPRFLAPGSLPGAIRPDPQVEAGFPPVDVKNAVHPGSRTRSQPVERPGQAAPAADGSRVRAPPQRRSQPPDLSPSGQVVFLLSHVRRAPEAYLRSNLFW